MVTPQAVCFRCPCPWILHVSPSRSLSVSQTHPDYSSTTTGWQLSQFPVCDRASCGNACESIRRGNGRTQWVCWHFLREGALSIRLLSIRLFNGSLMVWDMQSCMGVQDRVFDNSRYGRTTLGYRDLAPTLLRTFYLPFGINLSKPSIPGSRPPLPPMPLISQGLKLIRACTISPPLFAHSP